MMTYQRRILSGLMACLFALLLFVPVHAYGLQDDSLFVPTRDVVSLLDDSLFSYDGESVATPTVIGMSVGSHVLSFKTTETRTFSRFSMCFYATASDANISVVYNNSTAPTVSGKSGSYTYFIWDYSIRADLVNFKFTTDKLTNVYILDCSASRSNNFIGFPSPSSSSITAPHNTAISNTVAHRQIVSFSYSATSWDNDPYGHASSVLLTYPYPLEEILLGETRYFYGYIYCPSSTVDVSFYSIDPGLAVSPGCPIRGLTLYSGSSYSPLSAIVPDYSIDYLSVPGSGLDCRVTFRIPATELPRASNLYLAFDLLPSSAYSFSGSLDLTLYYYFQVGFFGCYSPYRSSSDFQLFVSWYEGFIRAQSDAWTQTFVQYMDSILGVLGQNSPELDQAASDIASADQLEGQYVASAAGAASGITNMSTPSELTSAAPLLANVASLVSGSGPLVPLFSLLVLLPVSVAIIAKLLNGGD